MPRVKKATNALKNRRNVLKATKGFRHGRSTKEKLAVEALKHAGRNAKNDRRKKKGDFRRLFTTKLNAALRENGETYSKFIDKLNKKGIKLNRKSLSEIAEYNPDSFQRLVESVK